MIAVDTSSLIAFFSGKIGEDVKNVALAFDQNQAVLAPAVICEIISDPKLPDKFIKLVKSLPVIAITDGYWLRAGGSRSALLKKGLKAKLADTLIAQSCIDHKVPLITRDNDFRHFVKLGLTLFS
jgi:predicted nucleic acid-binding protein